MLLAAHGNAADSRHKRGRSRGKVKSTLNAAWRGGSEAERQRVERSYQPAQIRTLPAHAYPMRGTYEWEEPCKKALTLATSSLVAKGFVT